MCGLSQPTQKRLLFLELVGVTITAVGVVEVVVVGVGILIVGESFVGYYNRFFLWGGRISFDSQWAK